MAARKHTDYAISLGQELGEQLSIYATKRGVSVSALVRTILSEWVQKQDWTTQREVLEEKHKHSLATSRGDLNGLALQRFLHLFPDFPFNPRDVYPIYSSPVDLIVFSGLEESQKQHCEQVILLEVKGGRNKTLEINQKAIRDCVESGQVEFSTISQQSDGSLYFVGQPRVP